MKNIFRTKTMQYVIIVVMLFYLSYVEFDHDNFIMAFANIVLIGFNISFSISILARIEVKEYLEEAIGEVKEQLQQENK